MRHTRALSFLVLLLALTAAPGCGKKGPPLAPMARVPGRVTDLSARRLGDTVYLSFTIPAADADGTQPASLSRVDVYAYTALRATDIRDVRDMVPVASFAVRRPPEPEEPPKPGKAPKPPKPREPGEDQGTGVVASEALTPALETLTVPRGRPAIQAPIVIPRMWFDTPLTPPLGGVVNEQKPMRFYVVVGVNRSGHRGPPSASVGVPLSVPPPAAPGVPTVTVSEKAIEVTWAPPPGAPLPIQEAVVTDAGKAPADAEVPGGTPVPPALAGTPVGMLLPVMPSYNVYAAGPSGTGGDTGAPRPPAALNQALLTVLTYSDEAFEFGVERCYEVRAVNAAGVLAVHASSPPPADAGAAAATVPPAPAATGIWSEGPPSPRTCVTPKDIFPPPVPGSLAAVASDGGISLIWEGVDAGDLAGYIVLRGVAPDGPMTPLFEAPIRETTYRDGSVKAGVRYAYAVVAVDRATPANRSATSNRVEETAR